jgi:hypothetical protein
MQDTTPTSSVKKANSPKPVACYIASCIQPPGDAYLRSRGLCQGMIMFGIPGLGVQFKCRVEGTPIDLEFAAFLSLLRTIETRLADEQITSIEVKSSNPEFVFAFSGRSRHLVKGSAREKSIRSMAKKIKIAVQLVEPRHNRAILSPADYPVMASGQTITFAPKESDAAGAHIKPFQRGVKL